MKNNLVIITLITIVCILCACNSNDSQNQTLSKEEQNTQEAKVQKLQGIIYLINENAFIIKDNNGGQYSLSLNTSMVDENKKECQITENDRGKRVVVYHTGGIKESFPAQFSNIEKVAVYKSDVTENYKINVGGRIFYGTNEDVAMGDSGSVTGKVLDVIPEEEVPMNEGQSNFGEVGAPYVFDDEYVEVFVNDGYYCFYPEVRRYSVFSSDSDIEKMLKKKNGKNNKLIKNLIGETALETYDSSHYNIEKFKDTFFLEVVNVFAVSKEENLLKFFVRVQGDGFVVNNDYIKSNHGFGSVFSFTFERDDYSGGYMFYDLTEFDKDMDEKDFFTTPHSKEYLKSANDKLNEISEDQENLMETETKSLLDSYLKEIGKEDFEVRID